MARRTLRTPAVLRAITAALAIVVLTAGPVSARRLEWSQDNRSNDALAQARE